MKALPILIYIFVFKSDKRDIFENAVSVGVGFSILENAYILSSNLSEISIPLAFVRGFGAGMMHGLCTFAVGFGMTYVYTNKKLFVPGTVAMLTVSVMYHSLYNILAQSDYQIVGFVLPILTFVPILIYLNKTSKA